jgi:uncharacterized protein (TIGR00375 family)
MEFFNADLHIHSPHSIAVSKSLNLDTMIETSRKKGLHILGTGDILQPDWFKYMEENLSKNKDNSFSYKGTSFILQSEIEDEENIHHVILFPDFQSVLEVQKILAPHSKNIYGEWGGRPRVNLSPPALVDKIDDSGAMLGPAHAFTPFKAIFRQNRYKTIQECYQDAWKKVSFLELGLSANTDLADRLNFLNNISFLSNSDAHSEGYRSLGREFNKFEIDAPSFDEICLALLRKNDRKIVLNIGLHPKLGKYYQMFCNKCRRRILFTQSTNKNDLFLNDYIVTDDFITYSVQNPQKVKNEYIIDVSKEKKTCPACKTETKKSYKIKLGVSERIEVISTQKEPIHPPHRPPYINAMPLFDILRSLKKVKSSTSKTIINLYESLITKFGTEFSLLLDEPIENIAQANSELATVIKAMRNEEIEYAPGGGGTYGHIKLEID